MEEITIPGLRFIVTSLCNYNCGYCHNEWEPKHKSITSLEENLIHELILEAKGLDAKEIDITGGEPLLKIDRVSTILKEAQSLNIPTNLTTNGYFLDNYKYLLNKLGLNEIHIHIPSLDSSKYKTLMQGNANLEKILLTVEQLNGLFNIIKINIPIIEGINDNEISHFLEYFNNREIIPRFIEIMSTNSFDGGRQRAFDSAIQQKIGNCKLENSYLWGINEYSSSKGLFETLRCICFDRKCTICHKNNFIHIDQDYNIRPCNLREFKIKAENGSCSRLLKEAYLFLTKQMEIPLKYKELWGDSYVPLSNIRRKEVVI